MTDFTELAIFYLGSGSHNRPEDGLCAMEAVAWLEGLAHTDHPSCTCPVVGAYVRALNDALPGAERQRLVAYLPRLVGTVSPGHEWKRARYLTTRAFGVHWPMLLRFYKTESLDELASELEQVAKWDGASLATRAPLVAIAACADCAELAELAARAARAYLAACADCAKLAALAALAGPAARADLAALYQAQFDTLDGVLKIGAASSGFSQPIEQQIEKYRALILSE